MAARSKDDLRIGTHTGNSIDAAGATAIAGALHVNTSISKLLLHSECAAAAAAVCVCVCVCVYVRQRRGERLTPRVTGRALQTTRLAPAEQRLLRRR